MNNILWNLENNYILTTVEILYFMPDYPMLIQSFIWQEYDHCPDFPVLHKFLNFWDKNLDGKVYSVTVSNHHTLIPITWHAPQHMGKFH